MSIDLKLVKKKLYSLLNSEELVEKYIVQYGTDINIKNIKQIKSLKKNQESEPSSGEGKDPTYLIKVRCPVCQQASIDCYELKAKSQAVTFDRFMTPRYVGATGFKTIQYSQVAVTVCPRCLFASPDKKDFITYSMTTRSEIKSQLGPMVLNRLKERIAERKEMFGNISNADKYFNVPRSKDAIVMGYQLCIHRALVEAEMDRPYSLYKAGAYSLRIAQYHKGNNHHQLEEDALRESLKYYEKCFSASNAPNQDIENQTTYIIVALCLRLGNDKQARAYIGVLDKLKADLQQKKKTDPTIKLASVELWEKKSKDLWEDREMDNLWD